MDKRLRCKVITPLFSFGNDKHRAEFRTTELKGLMRYTYRITQQEMSAPQLYQRECVLFGDAKTQASPIRIRMSETASYGDGKQELLCYHKDKDSEQELANSKDTLECNAIPVNTAFDIHLTLKKSSTSSIEWYTDLTVLSLLLGGMGKRSRRARGCVAVQGYDNFSRDELISWVCDRLNRLNEMDGSRGYVSDNNRIIFDKDTPLRRPVIEKIVFGEPIKAIKAKDFLTGVDQASHIIKDKNTPPCFGPRFATGYAQNGRFASSVIVSLVKTKGCELTPVYTCVKAILAKRKQLDTSYEERDAFLQKISERSKNF